jgi:hypothetical protein
MGQFFNPLNNVVMTSVCLVLSTSLLDDFSSTHGPFSKPSMGLHTATFVQTIQGVQKMAMFLFLL